MRTYPRIGACIPMGVARTNSSIFNRASQVGAEAVRVDMYWQDRDGTWSTELRVVGEIVSAGLKVLPIWNGPRGSDHWQTRQQRADWGDWAAEGASLLESNYPNKILAHQIGNELAKHELDVVKGADLIKRTSNKLRRVTSRPLVAPGLSPIPEQYGEWAAVNYLQGLYDNGCLDSWDVLACHVYSRYREQIPEASDWQTMCKVNNVALLNGDTSPIWITELGVPSEKNGMTEQLQATIVGQAVTNCPSWVKWLWYYTVDDYNDSRPNSQEGNFGVFRVDKTEKPVANVLRAI